jgi:hypothetical protein
VAVTFSPHQVFRPTGGGDFQSPPGCFADWRPRLCVLTWPHITIDCLCLAECNCDLQSLPGCISDRLTGGRDSNTHPAVSMLLTTIFGGFALPFLRPCPVMRNALSTLVGAIGSRPSALDTIPGPVHPARPVCPTIWSWPINHARLPVDTGPWPPRYGLVLDSRLSHPAVSSVGATALDTGPRCFSSISRDVQSPPGLSPISLLVAVTFSPPGCLADLWPSAPDSIPGFVPSARLLGPGQSTTPVCPDTGPWPSGHARLPVDTGPWSPGHARPPRYGLDLGFQAVPPGCLFCRRDGPGHWALLFLPSAETFSPHPVYLLSAYWWR